MSFKLLKEIKDLKKENLLNESEDGFINQMIGMLDSVSDKEYRELLTNCLSYLSGNFDLSNEDLIAVIRKTKNYQRRKEIKVLKERFEREFIEKGKQKGRI